MYILISIKTPPGGGGRLAAAKPAIRREPARSRVPARLPEMHMFTSYSTGLVWVLCVPAPPSVFLPVQRHRGSRYRGRPVGLPGGNAQRHPNSQIWTLYVPTVLKSWRFASLFFQHRGEGRIAVARTRSSLTPEECLQDVCFCSQLSLRCPPATRPGGLLSLCRLRLSWRQQHYRLPP